MSWDQIMRRILPPVRSISSHVRSPFGDTNRPQGSSNPHTGIDFNYVGGQSELNKSHQGLRAPVSGVVTATGGKDGTLAIRDANGFSHEILHTHARHVAVGDPVVEGQLIGRMGNTGVNSKVPGTGPHHVHYQLRDLTGRKIDPAAFWDAQGPADPDPAPPDLLREYQEYLRILGSNAGDSRPASPNTSDPFGTRGQFVPGSPTSSRPLYESRSLVPPPAENNPGQNVGRLVRVPTSTANRLTGAPTPNQLAAGDTASFDDRFGRWTVSPEASAPLGAYQGVPVSPDGRPLGIFSGEPMPQYPFPPPIWGFPEEEARQGSEDWAGWNPKPAIWNKKAR